MNSRRNQSKCSLSMNNINSYITDNINTIMLETTNQTELLVCYLKYIRNYKVLDDNMLDNINNFSDENKMIIIQELNNIMKSCIEHITATNSI